MAGALVLGVFLFGYGLRNNNPYLTTIPLLLVVGVFGLNYPNRVFLIAIALMNSRLIIPGMPGDLLLYHILLTAAAGVVFLRTIITGEKICSDPFLRFAALAYGFVTFYTMLARGIGFRIFGGDQVGGMRYVLVYIGVLTIWFVPNLRIKKQTLRRVFVWYTILAFSPVISEFLLLLSGGAIYQQYYFFHAGFGLGETFHGFLGGTGVRFTSASILGRALILVPFVFCPFKRKFIFVYLLFISMGLVCVLIAGFRSIIVSEVIFITIVLSILNQKHRKAYALCAISFVCMGVMFAYMTYDHLPFGAQRTLSFLPLIGEGSIAMQHSLGSTEFRRGVLQEALPEITNYLWLGRGMTYSISEVEAVMGYYRLEGASFVYGLITNLHHGPIEVLIYLGIPGVAAFIIFTMRALFMSLKIYNIKQFDPNEYRFPSIFSALILTTLIMFALGIGHAYGTFIVLCIHLSLLQIMFIDDSKKQI